MDNRKYPLDTGVQLLLKDLNISPQDVLRYANLPLDLFSRKSPMLTGKEYLRLWDGLAFVLRDNPTFPLDFATSVTPETFSPPIFACFCSPNITVAATRLAHYKPLVGPIRLQVQKAAEQLIIEISSPPAYDDLPANLIATELVWWVHMPRLATRERLVPLSVHLKGNIPQKEAYKAYLGVEITQSNFNGIIYSERDAERPFLTASDDMWSIFEPQLNQRMQTLDQNATYTKRVRASLIEMLASGRYGVDDVASGLAVSRRTLQRQLRNEGTSFQQVLDRLREELATHYLTKTDYNSGQIAFLLGYEEPNSFYRAFRAWTGQTPEVMRASLQ